MEASIDKEAGSRRSVNPTQMHDHKGGVPRTESVRGRPPISRGQ